MITLDLELIEKHEKIYSSHVLVYSHKDNSIKYLNNMLNGWGNDTLSRNLALVIAYLIHGDLVRFRATNSFDPLPISENRSRKSAARYSRDNISYVITYGNLAVMFTRPLSGKPGSYSCITPARISNLNYYITTAFNGSVYASRELKSV